MTTLEKEQQEDLMWAQSVLDGHGCDCDDPSAACNMLSSLNQHGTTAEIRQAASAALLTYTSQIA